MKAIANLPAPLRHLILVMLSAAVGIVSGEQTDVGAATTPVVTAAVAYALAALTPLVQSWGIHKRVSMSPLEYLAAQINLLTSQVSNVVTITKSLANKDVIK
jgi:hypothetical protein